MESDRSSGKRQRSGGTGNPTNRSSKQERPGEPARRSPPTNRPFRPERPLGSAETEVRRFQAQPTPQPTQADEGNEKLEDEGVGASRYVRKDPPNEQTLAARAVARSSRDYPADRCLKDLFRTYNTLLPRMRGRIRRAVFDYFRWQEWLDMRRPLELRVEQAVELSQWYRSNSTRIKNVVMLEKAVPAWVKEVMDVTPEWCRSLQTEPALWLRTRAGLAESVADILGGADVVEMGTVPNSLIYSGRDDLFRHPYFPEGAWEIQDLASQLVGWVADPQLGERWWDVCAGEGGKTLHIAERMGGRGLVWATDPQGWRLDRLRDRASRAKIFNYQRAERGAADPLDRKWRFDGILVDAPCSGLGTWGRNPQARWTSSRGDVEELSEVQRGILTGAMRGLKPGGKLVYSVCTLTRMETDEMADWVEATFPDLEPLACADPLRPEEVHSPRHTWWPQMTRGNGMFVATWRRRG